jgi:hypothetical protein
MLIIKITGLIILYWMMLAFTGLTGKTLDGDWLLISHNGDYGEYYFLECNSI